MEEALITVALIEFFLVALVGIGILLAGRGKKGR